MRRSGSRILALAEEVQRLGGNADVPTLVAAGGQGQGLVNYVSACLCSLPFPPTSDCGFARVVPAKVSLPCSELTPRYAKQMRAPGSTLCQPPPPLPVRSNWTTRRKRLSTSPPPSSRAWSMETSGVTLLSSCAARLRCARGGARSSAMVESQLAHCPNCFKAVCWPCFGKLHPLLSLPCCRPHHPGLRTAVRTAQC